jgi:hypothetical protein
MAHQTFCFDDVATEPEDYWPVCESHLKRAEELSLTEVSQDEFFRRLKADYRDIMPIAEGPAPYRSEWLAKSGGFFGLSVPVSRYKSGTRYFVK